jgi:hypothetical protein
MSARRLTLLAVSAALIAATGCGFLKKKEPPPADSTAVVATAAPVTEADVPTAEDFEDEAFTAITAQNFTTQLNELKKEIEAK